MENQNNQGPLEGHKQSSWIKDIMALWKQNPRTVWLFKLAAVLYVVFQLVVSIIAIIIIIAVTKSIIHTKNAIESSSPSQAIHEEPSQQTEVDHFFEEKKDFFNEKRKELDGDFDKRRAEFEERYNSFRKKNDERWNKMKSNMQRVRENIDKKFEASEMRKKEVLEKALSTPLKKENR